MQELGTGGSGWTQLPQVCPYTREFSPVCRGLRRRWPASGQSAVCWLMKDRRATTCVLGELIFDSEPPATSAGRNSGWESGASAVWSGNRRN